MKKKIIECRYCKQDTIHLVKRVCYKSHSAGAGGGVKYNSEHCTKCNKRWYNGKLSKPHEQRQERKRTKRITRK